MTPTDVARLDALLDQIRSELMSAMKKHPPMNSPHEGYAVIKEELDELWEHVRADTGRTFKASQEATQVAAMGVRYVLDLCGISQ